jgi:hypothetical protein
MGVLDYVKKLRPGRKFKEPARETKPFPSIFNLGTRNQSTRYLYKPTPRNIRYFSHTPYARRAINAIKNPIAMLEWEIAPREGVDLNSELERQIEVATYCLNHPNQDDSFGSLLEQTIEDYLCGAAAVEMQVGGDQIRPLWLYPVDGLSIQVFPMWTGQKDDPRYAQVIGYGTAFGGGVVAELRNDELMYIKPNPSTSTPFGFGPLEIAFNTINRKLGVEEFAGNVASNARPSVWIDMGNGMTKQDLLDMRAYWINEIEGQGKFPLTALGGGNKDEKKTGPQVMRLYPEGDAGLYLEYQQFLIRELAAAFDLSPMNFGVDGDVNRNQGEVNEDRDWNQAIKPVAAKISTHITREALHGKLGFSQLHHKFVGLDRDDENVTAEIFEKYYKNNAITPNEQRAKLGWKPSDSEWADMHYADVEIAKDAARSAATVLDDDLSSKNPKAKPAKPKAAKPKGN